MKTPHRTSSVAATAALLLALNTGPAPQAADYAGTVLSQNPLAYWRFNDTAPIPPALTAANAGSLGAAQTGYAVLDVASGEAGRVGNAFKFVNTGWTVGNCGSKIDVPFSPAINPQGSFTVEFWAKPSSLVIDLFCPLSALNGDAGVREGWLFYLTANNQWLFRVGGGSGYSALVQGGAVKPNDWQQVVGVYDAAANTLTLYVDGQKVAGPIAVTLPFVANTARAFRLGGTGLTGTLGVYAGNRGFDGLLDEVAFYGSVLSAERVAAHYDAAVNNNAGYKAAVLADQPLGYWGLDEPAYTAPDPATLPAAVNSGTLGAAANGTYYPGAEASTDVPPGTTFGADNQAIGLNGAVGHISVPNVEGLNFSGQITLMAWVKPLMKDNMRNIIAHGHITTPANAEVSLRISTNRYEVGTWDGTDYRASAPIPAGDIGNWVLLTGTYDGSVWKLYRNETLLATSEQFFPGAGPIEGLWSIGSRGDPPPADGRFHSGGVDEVALFNKALTAAQVGSIFRAAAAAPVIIQAPQVPPGTTYSGSSVTLTVLAQGSGTLTYQWAKDGTPIAGQTTATLTLSNLAVADSGTYTVAVSNSSGSTPASVVLAAVDSLPIITQQPASISRFAGSEAVLSVMAEGSLPLVYQWNFKGSPIAGATSATYTRQGLVAADGGNYSVAITNPQGQTTSADATLTVLTAPAGYPAAVVADAPMAYWRLGETSGTVAYDYWGGYDAEYRGAVVLGKDGFSLLDPDKAVGLTAAGSYVGGISGTEIDFTGPGVTFTLEAWVKGVADQLDGAGIFGKGTGTDGGTGDEQFCITVSGGKYHFYVRQASDNEVVECVADVGPNGSWQHLAGVFDGQGLMSLYVNGALSGSAITAPASGPRTSTHPVSLGARRGGVDPAYDLYFNGTIDEVAIYNTALTAESVMAHFEAQYGAGQKPVIQIEPVSVTTYVDLPARLTVAAAGSQPLSYQWKKNGANVTGATTDTLSFDKVATANAGRYTVVVDNPIGTVTSQEAVLTVLPLPTAPVEIPDLVAHWKFESNLSDDTGRGNNGTAQGQGSPPLAISYVDGKIGTKALHYETNTDDPNDVKSSYVTLGVRPDLQFDADQDFSVAFWVRLPLNYVWGDLPFICNALNSANNPGYTFAPSHGDSVAGSWGWSLYGTGDVDINVYGAVGAINDGGWYHLVHSFDRQGLGVTYLDGVVVDSRVITGIGSLDTGRPTSIGQDPEGKYSEAGSADLDDIGIFRRALSQLEATSIYAAGLSGYSFVNKVQQQPTITVQTLQDGSLRLQWDGGGALQQADQVTGSYGDIPGAASPYPVTPTAAQKFYRVKL